MSGTRTVCLWYFLEVYRKNKKTNSCLIFTTCRSLMQCIPHFQTFFHSFFSSHLFSHCFVRFHYSLFVNISAPPTIAPFSCPSLSRSLYFATLVCNTIHCQLLMVCRRSDFTVVISRRYSTGSASTEGERRTERH